MRALTALLLVCLLHTSVTAETCDFAAMPIQSSDKLADREAKLRDIHAVFVRFKITQAEIRLVAPILARDGYAPIVLVPPCTPVNGDGAWSAAPTAVRQRHKQKPDNL